LAESLRLTLGREGIIVQVVNPGFVGTAITARNDHSKPFMVSVEEAGRRICDGFGHDGFEIAFPRRLAWLMKAARLLPYPLYFALLRRMAGERQDSTRP
jgi:short-subunit dehydrogenase